MPSTFEIQSVGCEVQKDFSTRQSVRVQCNEFTGFTFLQKDQKHLETQKHGSIQLEMAVVKDLERLSLCEVSVLASKMQSITTPRKAGKNGASIP